jgi:hypothetical protein
LLPLGPLILLSLLFAAKIRQSLYPLHPCPLILLR